MRNQASGVGDVASVLACGTVWAVCSVVVPVGSAATVAVAWGVWTGAVTAGNAVRHPTACGVGNGVDNTGFGAYTVDEAVFTRAGFAAGENADSVGPAGRSALNANCSASGYARKRTERSGESLTEESSTCGLSRQAFAQITK